jgi:peptidoglycan/LPS O-acetylase OafA/YrhL
MFVANDLRLSLLIADIHEYLSFYSLLAISFFFTLSGFLITWIILHEIKFTNSFYLKNFYIRRSLRIWPLYFLMVGIGYGVVYALNHKGINTSALPEIYWFASFTINFYLGYINDNILFFLAFLWTIAVEEQFYLFWGVCMYFLHKNIKLLIGLFLLGYIVYSILCISGIIQFVYFNSFNYIIYFAGGIVLAHICFNEVTFYQSLKNLPPLFWKLFYSIFFVSLFVLQSNELSEALYVLRQAFFASCFLLILQDQCFNTTPLFNAGFNGIINYLGKISYGLYCWHGLAITIVLKTSLLFKIEENHFAVFIIYPLLSLLITIVLSIISYELFERKFLKLKHYFSAPIHSRHEH